jgi:hypothetical protein
MQLRAAAAYCGVPARDFRKCVNVPPVRLGPYELWDRVKLDAMIDALQGRRTTVRTEDWTEALKNF